eukprot:scaffold4536_cov113-Isochrysis_galbana.AAC.5
MRRLYSSAVMTSGQESGSRAPEREGRQEIAAPSKLSQHRLALLNQDGTRAVTVVYRDRPTRMRILRHLDVLQQVVHHDRRLLPGGGSRLGVWGVHGVSGRPDVAEAGVAERLRVDLDVPRRVGERRLAHALDGAHRRHHVQHVEPSLNGRPVGSRKGG